MGGKSASITSPLVANLQVQTSALGIVQPVGWGTNRVKFNLLWFNGFTPISHDTTTGGKGAGVTQTSYTYTADVIFGVTAGPITNFLTIYRDKDVLTPGASGLTSKSGAIGQAVWGYLTSAYPGQDIGYSGLSILYAQAYPLTDAGGLPNHSAEIQFAITQAGFPDANPKDILPDFLTNATHGLPGWGAGLIDDLTDWGNYCLATNLLLSPVLDAQVQAGQFITDLMTSCNSNCYWSEGLLKVKPYGDTSVTGNAVTWVPNLAPVYAIGDDNWVPTGGRGASPLQVDILDQSDAYNMVQVEYLDRTNQYNVAIQPATDEANINLPGVGRRKQDPTALHAITTAATAQQAAQLLLQRTLYVRRQFKFLLPWSYALLEPMDYLSLTRTVNGMGVVAQLVRIIQIDDDKSAMRAITAEEVPIGTSHSPIYQIQANGGTQVNFANDPGFVEGNLLLYANDFRSGWTSVNLGTPTFGHANPVTGAFDAQAVYPTTTNGPHGAYQDTTLVVPGKPYTASLYVHAQEFKNYLLRIGDVSTTNYAHVMIDASTGLYAVAATGFGTATGVTATITPMVLAGWYRLTLTATLPAIATVRESVYIFDNSGNFTYAANGSDKIDTYLHQFEPGSVATLPVQTWSQPAIPRLFNPPSVLTAGANEAWAAVGGRSPFWGGCYVWISVDGVNFTNVGPKTGRSRYGFATAALADAGGLDVTNTLHLDLTQSTNTSPTGPTIAASTHTDADRGTTVSMIGNELVAYGTVTQGASVMLQDLTYLQRGLLNSQHAAHVIGDYFVRLDDAIFSLPYVATQAGQLIYVKFQSFNFAGGGVQDLSACFAYGVYPVPLGAAAAATSAWTAVGTTFAGGLTIPAIVITGMSDNPSAQALEFSFRVTGTTAWTGMGLMNNATTRAENTGVTGLTSYDLSVVYFTNGVAGERRILSSSPVVTGAAAGFAPSYKAGDVIFADSVAGAGKTFTIPTGMTGHADFELWAHAGDGNYQLVASGKGVVFQGYGGSAGGYSKEANSVVVAGTTVVTYTLGVAGASSTVTITGTPWTLTANPGTNATTTASASATGTASGGTTNTTGHAGGLTNQWDGGGAAPAFADQTGQGLGGTTPGGGGSAAAYDPGSGAYVVAPGAAAKLIITAR